MTEQVWKMTNDDNSAFIYSLNKHGVNRWYAQIQPGFTDDDSRTPDSELHEIAKVMAASNDMKKLLEDIVQEYEQSENGIVSLQLIFDAVEVLRRAGTKFD